MRWSRAQSCLLASVLSTTLAQAAPPACAPDIVGPWAGKVLDDGQIKDLNTQFSTQSGELTGSYHVEGADGGFDGTLTNFVQTGPCAGRFLWHDRNGVGVVGVHFLPDRDRFDGAWGIAAPNADQIFTGHRSRPVPVS